MAQRGLSILVADDQAFVSQPLSLVLTRAGHRVRIVSDGRQALQVLSSNPAAFDVLITDQEMPELTGMELVKKLREENLFKGRIIVLSGSVSNAQQETFLALGVSAILQKPFDAAELLGALQDHITGD